MCIAMNGDQLSPGQYSVSTSNRNFEGRQGTGGRTFLASPLTAAASADNRRGDRREDTAMKPFRNFESRMVPLPINNIDTDQIIPARFLKTTSKEGLGDQLFYDWRYDARAIRSRISSSTSRASRARRSAGGRQFRLRQFARARAVGADAVRVPRGDQHFVRRHFQAEFVEELAAADGGPGGRACGALRGVTPTPMRRLRSTSRRKHSLFRAGGWWNSRWTPSPSTACSKAWMN